MFVKIVVSTNLIETIYAIGVSISNREVHFVGGNALLQGRGFRPQ